MTRTVQPIRRNEYEAMTREEHERAQLLALADLPKTAKIGPSDIQGSVIGVHEYLKIADKVTGARAINWDTDRLIGETPRRKVVVDQSDAEVSALLREWNKGEELQRTEAIDMNMTEIGNKLNGTCRIALENRDWEVLAGLWHTTESFHGLPTIPVEVRQELIDEAREDGVDLVALASQYSR